MLDFVTCSPEERKDRKGNSTTYITPIFRVRSSKDLMIRGGDFYAVWDESAGFWSTDEDVALDMIDDIVDEYAKDFQQKHQDHKVIPLKTISSKSGVVDAWHKYVQKQMRDHYHSLDEKLVFSNDELKKTDYASKQLPYALEEGDISAYEELISTLYSPEERHKLEWAVGAVVTGDSKKIQKFIVLHGSAGTGKSTFLNIVQMLFDGYCSSFDAKALGSATNVFALEAFKSNPLVAIQHDGDLSRIEDNTRLNSLISHEKMMVNEKFKSSYENRFNSFLFMGTNKPVKITDAKSGIIRRLIDVYPTGNKVPQTKYKQLMSQIKFELGAIAYHCKNVYLDDPDYYDGYIPTKMIGATNDFFNFVEDNYLEYFSQKEDFTLTETYNRYKQYCPDNNILYPLSRRAFKEELKNYFDSYSERKNGQYSVYSGFKKDKFFISDQEEARDKAKDKETWLKFDKTESLLDKLLADCPAQYVRDTGKLYSTWENCETKLKDLDTSKIHHVLLNDIKHIVIDFDIKDESGNKSFEKNLEAASKFPKTYAELSKSGAGIHLHYFYDGDVTKLSAIYGEDIEVKVFNGKASLRRKLTKCNDIPIATINSGLPVKGDVKKVLDWEAVKSEKQLKALIEKALRKEIGAGATAVSVSYIKKILDEAYESAISYDVSNYRQKILVFAANSKNQAPQCIKMVNEMHFRSDVEPTANENYEDERLVFFDCEVFPNLFLINWKYAGSNTVVRMINPTADEVDALCKRKLIGFNCRRYDNHILYAAAQGYSNEQLFNLSQKLVNADKKNRGLDNFFQSAYNISYTDIYDYLSADHKMSLKKWEIKLGIHHLELGLPWDKPVPKELWERVAEYCDNDVISTEAVWNATQADFEAREILVELANHFCSIKSTVNTPTNTLTARIIFGDNKHPQSEFKYTNLSTIFNGYLFENFKSTYKGYEVGEGGFVWARPGMYDDVWTFDVASMHPHSVIALNLFGDKYTQKFKDIVDLRILIKHKQFAEASQLWDGILAPYLSDPAKAKALSGALKTAINSVYGLTAAKFENQFRDPRNVDNIVAKRGALFMINLKEEVEKRGYTVVHIKTDSIKVAHPDEKIINFINEYGQKYGYTFEVEHKFERICLVNDAVYIGKLTKDDAEWLDACEKAKKDGKPEPTRWTATGAQFAVPYVFKTLFSHEPIKFDDKCETKSVKTAIYLDNNEGLPDVTLLEKQYDKLAKIIAKADPTVPMYEERNELEDLALAISRGHDYQFVGKVGRFCPIKPGFGGGLLMASRDNGYSSVTGTKGYRWMESEKVTELGLEDAIDISYYQSLADTAKDTISEYGDFEYFVSDELTAADIANNIPNTIYDETPFVA